MIYNRIYSLLVLPTLDNQFGFKKKHLIRNVIFALKQYLSDYNNNNNTNIFVVFLGESKTFDKLNHNILFHGLKYNNVPYYIMNFLNIGTEIREYILSGVIIYHIEEINLIRTL